MFSFEMTAMSNGILYTYKSNSGKFTDEMKALFASLKPNSRLYIENVKVVGPDGNLRTIPGITLKIN